jgi:hypothetical protein
MHTFRRTLGAWLGIALLLGVSIGPASAAADAVSTWTAGPSAVGDPTYDGFVDTPAANATVPNGGFAVSGWFVDTSAQGWAGADDMQVFLGSMDGGGKQLAKGSIGQNRPDVAAALGTPFWAASGFTAFLPAGSVSVGPQTLTVYVHTPDKGWWYKEVPVNVSSSAPAAPTLPAAAAPAATPVPGAVGGAGIVVAIEKPTEGEVIPTKNDYEVIGYALDKAAAPNQGSLGSGIDRVQLYIGNDRTNGGIYLGDATLGFSDNVPSTLYGQQFGYSGWRLTFKPTQFHANTFILYAYAHSVVTNKEDSVGRFFAIHE